MRSIGARPVFGSGSVVVHPDGIGDCHGPKCRGMQVAPADSSMKHGCASHGHDCLNGPHGNTVLMMGTHTSKVGCLAEGEKIVGKSRRGEDRQSCQTHIP